jgi:hypothetical protein
MTSELFYNSFEAEGGVNAIKLEKVLAVQGLLQPQKV